MKKLPRLPQLPRLKKLPTRAQGRKQDARSVHTRNIIGSTYDPDRHTLTVEFHWGGRYRYSNIPADLAAGFQKSAHQSSYLNQYISGIFTFSRIDLDDPGVDTIEKETP